MKVDFIIVGQGLAGTTLAITLMNKSKSFIIIDDGSNKGSSFSAAGVAHPISFKRLILSWNAEKLIPYSKKFYKNACKLIDENCYYEKEMLRIFSSIEEQNNWHVKIEEAPLNAFIDNSSYEISKYNINASLGFGAVKHASRLNVSGFVKHFRKYFEDHQKIIKESFDHSLLKINDNNCQYNERITADKIIFCEGPLVKKNPFFNYLPFGFNKGETITIKTNELPNKLLSKGCFVLPIKNNEFIVGSTYDHQDLETKITEKGRKELIQKLSKLGSFNYEIVSQKSGIRPSTKDRKPIIGEHPIIKNVFLFNGLGSKGVMLAPYFANELLDSILKNLSIDSEVAIERFSKDHLYKFKRL